jgi:phosphoserine phosphatase RsbU/P
LVRVNGDVEYLNEGGMVVGLFAGVRYERGHVKLHPGDVVVFCTDGITEANNSSEDEYGTQRLLDLVTRERHLPAQEIVQAVMSSVDAFSRGGTHEDDRVILILKVS